MACIIDPWPTPSLSEGVDCHASRHPNHYISIIPCFKKCIMNFGSGGERDVVPRGLLSFCFYCRVAVSLVHLGDAPVMRRCFPSLPLTRLLEHISPGRGQEV